MNSIMEHTFFKQFKDLYKDIMDEKNDWKKLEEETNDALSEINFNIADVSDGNYIETYIISKTFNQFIECYESMILIMAIETVNQLWFPQIYGNTGELNDKYPEVQKYILKHNIDGVKYLFEYLKNKNND